MNEPAGGVAAATQLRGPGAVLRRGREARGLTVDEVAHALKLTPRQVAAIESENFASLKGQTFARGFVRNYARFLQIDPSPLLAQMEDSLAAEEVALLPPSNADGAMPSGDSSRSVPRSLAVLAIAAAVGLTALLIYDRYRDTASKNGQPPAKSEVQQAPVSAAPPAPVVVDRPAGAVSAPGPAAPVAPAAAEAAPAEKAAPPELTADRMRRLTLRFEQESWVEVKDGGGRVLVSSNHQAGSSRMLEGVPPLTLTIGNAEHVRLAVDERTVDLKPYTEATVARLRLD